MKLFHSDELLRDFSASLGTRHLGQTVTYVERTGSTNDLALMAAKENAPHGALFIADAQDSGRGRRGRSWESPAGLSLLFSVLVRPEKIQPSDIGWIPLAAGLACAEAIAASCALHPQLKWPNDIIIPAGKAPGWRKLGGILCESVLPPPGVSGGHVVIGIGINANQQPHELPEFAKAPPTSVRIETAQEADRLAILAEILRCLEQRCDQLLDQGLSMGLKSEIESCLRQWWPPSRQIQAQLLSSGSEVMRGSFAGLDEYGRLKLKNRAGKEHALADAEIIGVS